MGRHNREGDGSDQKGFVYELSYQPDWLRHVKVTRTLPSGRQSTMTLFRNPVERRARPPGERVRTRIICAEQGIDLEVVVNGGQGGVSRVSLTCEVPSVGAAETEEVTFTLEKSHPGS